MIRHPENPDANGDRLDQPGALPTPPLDPQLEPLLDEALDPAAIPGGLPGDLVANVLARTQPLLARSGHGVLARIGPTSVRVAVAATVFLGLSAGLFFFSRDSASARQARTLDAVSRELDALKHYVAQGGDEDMALLATRIDLARTRPDWDLDDLTAPGQPDLELDNDGPSDTF